MLYLTMVQTKRAFVYFRMPMTLVNHLNANLTISAHIFEAFVRITLSEFHLFSFVQLTSDARLELDYLQSGTKKKLIQTTYTQSL